MFDDLQATIDAATHYQDPHVALGAAIAVALAVRRHANDLNVIERQAKELAKIARRLEVSMVDHLIIGWDSFSSLRQLGHLR